ncbi:hypothetical protein [Pseudomonas argentinensis]|uniref:hypothetical protein n=1 Tax=Phytopseudomonas argentinensis TaxID=289370 RepID=UPI001113BF79|nr:hypothetical protein [Pseudomonas argentinensis]
MQRESDADKVPRFHYQHQLPENHLVFWLRMLQEWPSNELFQRQGSRYLTMSTRQGASCLTLRYLIDAGRLIVFSDLLLAPST